ncbi:MAG TPA: FimV/HubP family polar landmark protein, partial [Burkholderiaceae bacterium]|nr:FimV/HubP family polar landmark protein [Burkholderiaceae bacterium]
SASQLDSNEVDPVAEADVYIAYGRDAQAEEILKEALRTQPDRNAVRVKLLEIYANRKDVRSFEVLASELYGLTKGEGEDWQQAASLGLSIDPKNPLYAAGKVSNEATTLAAGAHTQPLEEHDLDDLVPNTHTRPSMESPNTLEESPYFGSTTLGRIEPDTIARHPEPQQHGSGEELPPLNVNTSTSLDFDLDGMDAEQPAVAEHVPAPAATSHTPATVAPAAEHRTDFGSADFDFIDETPGKSAEPTHHVAPAPGLVEDFHSIPAMPAHVDVPVPSLPEVAAMDLDQTLIHTPAPTPAESKALDFDLSGITLELDQPGKSVPSVPKAAEDHAFDLHVPEIPSVDFHAPEIHAPAAVHKPEHAPELHAMDLQFPESHPTADAAPAHRAEPALDMVPDLIAHGHSEAEVALDTGVDHEYSNNAEMATKLDLAVAYQEIGDKEGARELLEEVIHGGVSEHSEKAKAILAKLG